MFDLVKSSSATTYPWVITKEIYLVQDTRPLYHYPEFKITTTKYDNWEPQFKPVNQQNLETKNQLSLDDPKANETAVGVLRMLMNTIIEEDDNSSLVESASYDTHSTHTLHTKSGGDNKDDDGTGSRIDKKKDDSHDDDNGEVGGGGGDDDRSHKTASDSKSIGSKSKDILKDDDNAVSKDDNSIHSRHNNDVNDNDNANNVDDSHDVNDDMNHDDDDDDENEYSEDH